MSDWTYHGVIGDMNPIEHGGGIVMEREGEGPILTYFQPYDAEGEPKVTVSWFSIEDDVVEDLNWVDWPDVARFMGMDEDELKGYARDENVLARANVYESVGSYHGFINLDGEPQELDYEVAEERYGDDVDQAHAAFNKARASNPTSKKLKSKLLR